MRKKIGGKIGPGSPANMGHMGKSTAKMMKKSPLEINTDPPKKGEGKYDYIDKMGPQVDNTPEGRGKQPALLIKLNQRYKHHLVIKLMQILKRIIAMYKNQNTASKSKNDKTGFTTT